ncbi:MAG: peptidylprolyl isomerase [Micromonosporaceae bacterium]
MTGAGGDGAMTGAAMAPVGHSHAPSAARQAAAVAQREAAVIGRVGGVPVSRERLDQRLGALRAGPRAAALPVPGSSEDRQFVRWVAHVLFTEELCHQALADRPAPAVPPLDPAAVPSLDRALAGRSLDRALAVPSLDPAAAVQLGSINTAAWRSCAAVAEVFALVVPAETGEAGARAARRWWRVDHALAPDPGAASAAELVPLGWTTLDDLPAPLASALRTAVPGERVGPVQSPLGWHVARVEAIEERADGPAHPGDLGERLREYARWLDRRRADTVRTAPGFEHPGDPSQPDNTHRH